MILSACSHLPDHLNSPAVEGGASALLHREEEEGGGGGGGTHFFCAILLDAGSSLTTRIASLRPEGSKIAYHRKEHVNRSRMVQVSASYIAPSGEELQCFDGISAESHEILWDCSTS